eukprot:1975058-Amphidinium_carterae.1
MRRYLKHLCNRYGENDHIPLYRENTVYNMYVVVDRKTVLGALGDEMAEHDATGPSGGQRQAKL